MRNNTIYMNYFKIHQLHVYYIEILEIYIILTLCIIKNNSRDIN